jgi:hypothetical protein
MIQTKNFNPITDPKLLCTCGHPDCDKRSVSQDTLNRTQSARYKVKRSLTVRSGGRCPNHPDELHRDKPADHQKRQGVDIGCNGGLERGELVQVGIECRFNAIGVGKSFVHWGFREELPVGQIMMWTY